MGTKSILVTGGCGFIGGHLVRALAEAGHQVRVLDALLSQVHGDHAPALPDGVELLRGDVADPAVVERAVAGVDAVFHDAAEVGVAQSMYEMVRYVHRNSYGTAVLLDAIARHRDRVRKLVVASSMSIYGEGGYVCAQCGTVDVMPRPAAQLNARQWDPLCPVCGRALAAQPTPEAKRICPTSIYAITKQDQEQLCLVAGRAYGVPTVALRYFNVYGPGQALSNPYTGVCAIFSARLLNGRAPLVFEDGAQTRDFVHVSDVVAANLLALETDAADFQAVNVGTGTATSIARVAEVLAQGLGKNIPAEITGKYREGDIRHCVADISRARKLLGYEPRVSFADGMRQLLAWVAEQTPTDDSAAALAELARHQLVH